MSIDSIRAAQAYLQAQATGSVAPSGDAVQEATSAASPSFANLVEDALARTQDNLNVASNAASSVATGDANLVDVVTSISAAEVSLETAIAVRNRMIEAYQEIMRMPI